MFRLDKKLLGEILTKYPNCTHTKLYRDISELLPDNVFIVHPPNEFELKIGNRNMNLTYRPQDKFFQYSCCNKYLVQYKFQDTGDFYQLLDKLFKNILSKLVLYNKLGRLEIINPSRQVLEILPNFMNNGGKLLCLVSNIYKGVNDMLILANSSQIEEYGSNYIRRLYLDCDECFKCYMQLYPLLENIKINISNLVNNKLNTSSEIMEDNNADFICHICNNNLSQLLTILNI